MDNTFLFLLLSVFVSTSEPAAGCTIEGIDNWIVAEYRSILDTFRGTIWDRSTSNIQGINSISYIDGLNKGPYVTISLIDSRLVISTNDAFESYEEHETLASMGFTISFRCSDGSARSFVFQVGINDTNNNDPQFRPSNFYEFTIAPPIPPGFLITNCVNDIIVRDIDLTTERIDFEISGSSLFQITYDNSSNIAKEFKAALRSTTLIRSISEPIHLIVTATDVDRTGDPRRTATATITVTADTEFRFPDEPIFSQPFYLALYTANNDVIIQESIYLHQGYDDQVVFSLDGQHSQYFELVQNGNNVYFKMKSPLPVNLFSEGQIFLVVKAEREFTSGDTATIVVQLPEVVNLEFEARVYEGSIEDNKLKLMDLKLKQGYEDTTINVDIKSEYKSYFSTSIDVNTITLSMVPLSDSIIKENNQINLQVTATTAANSSETTIVILEIIKDDITTPIFEKNIYTGYYDLETGLHLERIVLMQGYDNTVDITLEGEHSSLFKKEQNGPIISLSMSSMPSDLLVERNILVTVRAAKPRTVGANTAVQIILPSARQISFEKFIYKGNLEDNIIDLETIILSVGYDSDINFNLTGDHADFFYINVTRNELSLGLKQQLPEIVLENSFLVLVLSASGTNTVTASVTIFLEIIKQDTFTPVFSQYIYQGAYINSTYIDFEAIRLIQGFDDTVTYELEGDHAKYFSMNMAENYVMLSLKTTIPEDLIFNEKVLLLNIKAEKPRTVGANAAIRLVFPEDLTELAVMKFSQNTYNGIIKDEVLTTDNIVLESGFTVETKFLLIGDLAENFTISNTKNEIIIKLSETFSLEALKKHEYIILEIEATRVRAVSVTSTLVINISNKQIVLPVFEKPFYTGIYTKVNGLQFTEKIGLQLGFDETVTFKLEGDHAEWFSLLQDGNSVSLLSNVTNLLPDEVFYANSHLLFTIKAQKPDTIGGRAAISISLLKEVEDTVVIEFERNSYMGRIENGSLIFTDNIRIINIDISSIGLNLTGEYASYFKLSKESDLISINLLEILPEDIIDNNDFIILYLEATASNAISSHTTIILNIVKTLEIQRIPVFEQDYYIGEYSKYDGLIFLQKIRLIQGYDETISFDLDGDDSKLFLLKEEEQNILSIAVKDDNGINEITGRSFLIFSIVATNSHADVGRTAVIIHLKDDTIFSLLKFVRRNYIGSLNNNTLKLEPITLTEGYSGNVTFAINKEYTTYFRVVQEDATVNIELIEPIPEEVVPANKIIVIELKASAPNSVPAFTTIILVVNSNETLSIVGLHFDKHYYTGNYDITGLLNFSQVISLVGGYDESAKIEFDGELSQWFKLQQTDNTAEIKLKTPVPDTVLSEFQPLIFSVTARKGTSDVIARAVIIITHNYGSDSDASESFDKVLYRGNIKNGIVSHEMITLSRFSGSNIIISGDLATSFESNIVNGIVVVEKATSAALPENLSYTVLTLHADSANAVLILDISASNPDLPTVSFDSQSYFLWADINQTGVVGKVTATVDNGEAVLYSVTDVENDDLRERVSINAEGELLLSATVEKGVYNFQVSAMAQVSQVIATVPVLLRVDALPECSTQEGLPPLIVLQRVEEEPHLNLVVLNQTYHKNCWYTITSFWPEDQSWLYIENGGLHAKVIDREHKSIAFMIQSQIQAELILHCDNDNARGIVKRSLATDTGLGLDTYDYGSNKWIIADTITYNAGRSVVNLIVEDINDNAPVFKGKENEPIYVGYPIPELENTILPRALIELKATDADIGENAALMYWSMEENLAIASTTGYVHVRNNAYLENNARFTVYATDQNGRGLNGSLAIVIKLLERNQIAVITVRNAFLDDEGSILSNLSTSVGYDIKILRTVVISENNEETEASSRNKREIPNTYSASLQLFVYGMSGSQLIDVDKLTSDLDQVVSVNKVRVKSLEDHLESLEICPVPGQHTALLASTITLAVILFIVIVAVTAWFLIKWRNKQNYEKFSDANSLASRIEADSIPKVESLPKPRLDIEELKRSERRLQEMLDAPAQATAVQSPKQDTYQVKEPESSQVKPEETLINLTADSKQPIVIQSIDKLKDIADDSEGDEFGEVELTTPRKSVVTFNENVEKIIHIDYDIDDSSEPDTEVYRF